MIVRVIGSLKNQGCLLVVGFNNTIGNFQFNLILKNGQWEFSINSINAESKVLLKTRVNIDFKLQVHSEIILWGESLTPHSFTPLTPHSYGKRVTAMETHRTAHKGCQGQLPMFLNDSIFEIMLHFLCNRFRIKILFKLVASCSMHT